MFARLTACLAVFMVVTLNSAQESLAQYRDACLIKVSNAPNVYIDSFANDVVVRTTEGRQVKAYANMLLCPGDEVRTGPTARVSIRFEKKRTVVRLDGNSHVKIRPGSDADIDVGLKSGILYFLSSVGQWFAIETPYIVAGIEGTEALVASYPAQGIAMTAVREGVVSAYSKRMGPASKLRVHEGEAAFRSNTVRFQKAAIDALRPPFRELVIASDSSVDWAVYYPPILLAPDVENYAVRQAVVYMSSGDYERASSVLNASRGTAPSVTSALRAIIAVGRNRLTEAQHWASLALSSNPKSASAHIASSYVAQAKGNLQTALQYSRRAAELAPDDAYSLARLAEMEMTIGDRIAGFTTAQSSLAIKRVPLALFISGLAKLIAAKYEAAESDFEEAIQIDPESPLPRLGLGLAHIRQGDVAGGAWEIERALAHDPRRAVLRTWLGKAYFDEGLEKKAAAEFRLSRAEDPDDPRPYVFSAFERFAANSPIEALKQVLEAEKLGPRRKTLRSDRGLGEDAAARGAALGRIFDMLDFGSLAISAGSSASDTDPSNPGAHRFMADIFRTRNSANVAQTSELLRSQVLSPPSKTPVQPQLAEARLALLDTTGPARVSFAEFSPFFDSDGVRLDVSGLYGTQNTKSYEAAITGLYRNVSASIGTFSYETEGYRENNDVTHEVFNAVSTIALSPEFSLFGEYRTRETNGGDRRLNFNIDEFGAFARQTDDVKVSRIGFHLQPSVNSDLIGVFTKGELSTVASDKQIIPGPDLGPFLPPLPATVISITGDTDIDGRSLEVQYLRNDGRLRSVMGGSLRQEDNTINNTLSITGPFTQIVQFPESTRKSDFRNVYGYYYLTLPAGVDLTAGGTFVDFENDGNVPEISEFHPKLGATAKLGEIIKLRGAYLKSLKPNLISEQTIEPSHVAGFAQFYDSFDWSVLEQTGAGVEIHPLDGLWLGGEVVKKSWDHPTNDERFFHTDEDEKRLYLYLAFFDHFSLSAEWRQEKSLSDLPSDFPYWKTDSYPVTLSYFSKSGFFASATIEYVEHSFTKQAPRDSFSSIFTTCNATAGYRFPNSRGVISIEALNIFDEEIEFQNRYTKLDLFSKPRYAVEPTVYARGTIKF